VYAVETTTIDPDESVDELRNRLVGIGCAMLERYLAGGPAGLPVPRDQVGTPTYADKLLSHEFALDWERPAVHLRRIVRLGRAWTTFRGKRLRVLAAGPAASDPAAGGTDVPLAPGELSGTTVGAGEGTRLEMITVQPEGKRPMEAAAWRNGVQPGPGDRLGS